MLVALWSTKGGSGVTTTTVGLAAALARLDQRARPRRGGRTTQPRDALLVDLAGDALAACGAAEVEVGVGDWLESTELDHRSLARLEVEVADGLSVLPAGRPVCGSRESVARLAEILALDDRGVVVDLGSRPTCPADASTTEPMLAAAELSLLVTRPCYLGLRRAVQLDPGPDGVVVLREAGRALDSGDISDVVGAPVLAEIDVDPAVARAVDAGLMLRSPHRPLVRALRSVL